MPHYFIHTRLAGIVRHNNNLRIRITRIGLLHHRIKADIILREYLRNFGQYTGLIINMQQQKILIKDVFVTLKLLLFVRYNLL
ncbi:hypothetical protein D3C81_2231520 [compost metagenome]